MKFLLDNNVARCVANGLISRGNDVRHVSEIGLHRAIDPVIWRKAVNVSAVLVTHDWPDFTGLLRTTKQQTLPLPLAVLRYNYDPKIESVALVQFAVNYVALAEVAESISTNAKGRVFAAIDARTLTVTFHDTCMEQRRRGKKKLGAALAQAQFFARPRGAFELQLA